MAMNWRGEVQRPCPQCGSANVRWRERRAVDVVRTWLRFLLELPFRSLLHLLSGTRRQPASPDSGLHSTEQYHAGGTRVDFERMAAEAGARFEGGMSTETADRFWRCGDCGRRGREYDRLAEIMGMASPGGEAKPPERRW
jgi:hypothetical protein